MDFGVVGTILIAPFYRRLWLLFRQLKAQQESVWRGFFEGASVCILVLAAEGVTAGHFTPVFPQSYMWLAAGLAIGMAKRIESCPDPATQPLRDVVSYRPPTPNARQNLTA